VYTPENPEYPHDDHSLLNDVPPGMPVLKKKIWEPYRIYRLITGKSSKEKIQPGFLNERRKPGLADHLATWLRGNLFIPDARKFWIRPSVKYLSAWLSKNPVDAMVSTGPPHSMHLIALKLKRRSGIPWLADFRDPWTQIDFYHKLRLTGLADRKHKSLESAVLGTADRVVTVSSHCAAGLEEISRRKVDVVTNGFDPDDFRDIPSFSHLNFSLTHLGAMNPDRNPVALWEVLAELVREIPGFSGNLEIKFIGKTDITVGETLEKLQLKGFVRNLDYLPHDQALREAGNSAVLLLALNNTPNAMGIAPGKLYEYLALKRPVLCIGPEKGDAAAILKETKSGFTAGFGDKERIKKVLLEWYGLFTEGQLEQKAAPVQKYARPVLTGAIASILNEIARG
jgi:glycosyltransferase involved in cell wall biosynthesis